MACALPHATPACKGSSCVIASCDPGYADCDMSPKNGCEINTAIDTANCNGCGNVCPFGPNSSAQCVSSMCTIACTQNHADCDMNPKTGCEVNLLVDPQNCGNCGNKCGIGKQCLNGICN